MWATLALFASLAVASASDVSKTTNSRVKLASNGVTFNAYHPPSTFEVFEAGVDTPLAARGERAHYRDAALSYVEHRLGSGKAKYRSGFEGDVSSHVFVNQYFNGIRVANAVANVAQNKAGKVTSFASSFLKAPRKIASARPVVSTAQAAAKAAAALGGTVLPGRDIVLQYLAVSDDEVVLTHAVHLEISPVQRVLAYVDAATGDVVSVVNETYDLTYRAIPITKHDPNDGWELHVDPEDPIASPKGWITTRSNVTTHATEGTNIISTLYRGQRTSPESSTDTFDYSYDLTLEPTDAKNTDAAVVNSFYILNKVHDIVYRYGFTENNFNFQGADPIFVRVQSTLTTNNAIFFPTPDGTPPEIHLLLWTLTRPRRESAVEIDILAHEVTHGLTDRLIGGGTSGCLRTLEAGGLAEGWSDAFADWLQQTSTDIKDFTLGSFVINNPEGIRTQPYSTDPAINTLTYELLKEASDDPHYFGELWAQVLHLQLAALTEEYGYSEDAFTNPDATGGNAVWLHLFIDALPSTPCQPTFRQARLAWIQADENRYGGKNKCLLWRVFASRGIGLNADGSYNNNHDLPEECQ
ncbi:hypothetical protein AURDEDRAFT_51142 [Auricularia subglabra TFB-10046 SS5]|nr:hypothetical protein AURDEDRAFT_51142 [Auricularia subglabra TFB-10046 SS5]